MDYGSTLDNVFELLKYFSYLAVKIIEMLKFFFDYLLKFKLKMSKHIDILIKKYWVKYGTNKGFNCHLCN